jgi:hypothetical protein
VAVSIEAGTRLGPYEVKEFIGQGAMGVVYRAYHPKLERYVAVKVLQGMALGADSVARFHHEAQAIAQMRHQNIVNVFDFGEHDGTPYMIVEYVPGGNLANQLEQTPLEHERTLKYLRGIGAALDYAHSLGIVHRDVKPGNVLLEKDGTPVLADFGLVKLLQGSSLQSLTGVTTGTPAYMAPEQVTGHDVGPAADRYSLATIAYEMLTGAIPFDGEGVLEMLYAHVHREPIPPSARNASLGALVDAVIMRGLAKDPNARWLTCAEFVDALTAALAAAPDKTVVLPPPQTATKPLPPASGVKEAAPAATIAVAMPERVGTLPKPARSRRRLIEILAGVAILLLLLLAGGICAAAGPKPTMSLTPRVAVPGQTLLVTAAHLPANQLGEIHLLTKLYTFQFQSNSDGDVRTQFEVPTDVALGDHHVQLCWNNACPLELPLKVVAPGTLPSPTPTPSTGPTPTAGGTPHATPTPGASPVSTPTTGGSTPKASPKPRSSPSPGRSPSPSPVPSPSINPCPTPSPGPTLTPTPTTVIGGGNVSLAGVNFTPNTFVTLRYYKGTSGTASQTWTAAVGCNGKFSTSVKSATTLVTRQDNIKALDTGGRSATAYITVLL